MRPLRIAVVAPPFYEVPPQGYGGIERVVALLVDELSRLDHEVTLIAVGPQRTHVRYVPTMVVAPGEGTDDDVGLELLHAARAKAALRDLDADVLHLHSRGSLLIEDTARATLATVHGSVRGAESQVDLYRAIGPTLPLVAVSNAQRIAAPDLAWAGMVHNGVDASAYPFREDKDDYALFLGRLSPGKGPDLAMAAAAAAGRRLVVAGAATTLTEHRWVESELARWSTGHVEFLGEVTGARRLAVLSRAACLLHPSRWEEPFGLAVIEAMACGTPVVVTSRGALPELVVDGETGVVCDDPDLLPEAVERAAALRPGACRNRVLEKFSSIRMAEGYLEIYEELLG